MAPRTPLILAIDIGSSSTRALVFDGNGAALPAVGSRSKYLLQTTPDGGAELDMAALAAEAERCIDETLAALPPGATIAAVGCATLVGNLLGLDAAGAPLTPIWTWADTRAAAWAGRLRAEVDPAAIWRRTGCPIHSSYLPARLRWLAATDPALFGRVRRWVTIGEYLTERWLGAPLLSPSVASWHGLFNRENQGWDAGLLALLPIQADQLNQPCPADATRRGLAPAYAARWPALRDAAWIPPIGDGVASNLGVGANAPEHVAINLGTSGAMRVICPAGGPIPDGLWCYRVDAARELIGGALSNGGNLIQWAGDTLRLPDGDALEQGLADLPAAGHGLIVLPYWAGERSPHYREGARAAILGMTLDTAPLELVRAQMEAVAYTFASIYERLLAILPPEHTLSASGGALGKSAVWRQILCDALGVPLRLGDAAGEATARGAALLAGAAAGLAAPAGPLLAGAETATLSPNLANHERHRRARAAAEAYGALILGQQRAGG